MYSAPRISAPFQHLLQKNRLSGNTILKFLMALGLSLHCTAQVVDPITAAQAPIRITGFVGIGTGSPNAQLEVKHNVRQTGNSGASIIFPDRTIQSTAWSGTLCGGDYAESVDVSGDRTQYQPGDVLLVDPNNAGHFLKASERYSTSVAGIYSTKPGLIGRRQTIDPKMATTEIPMAMVGIVPTKVTAENGPIHPGDIFVTSSS